ncbi:MAG: transposase, partial [Candidatus Woesearchaeota archaeon]|nr:transposase [Candidatus Woesearchaeota archaeon]
NIDEEERDSGSLVELNNELKDKEVLKSKILNILSELKKEEDTSINSTDRDCSNVKGRQGTHAGYNGQIVVDEKHGLIVSSDVSNDNNDRNQFANQIDQANTVLDKKCTNACADAGYANTEDLHKVDQQGITVIVPTQKQASNAEIKQFDKEQFKYDLHNDCYICPEGQTLVRGTIDQQKKRIIYEITDVQICLSCKQHGICTNAKHGRRIRRLFNENTKIKLEQQYQKAESQAIYKLRKEKVEHPFGHLKNNLGVQAFLLRGLDGVKAEMALLATCFNISRMITLLGMSNFMEKVGT